MVGMVQPGRCVEHQPGETLARDGGHLGGHPAAHGMPDEMRPVEAERVDEPQIVDDHVLHAGEMRGGIALAEAGMEGQEDAEAVGETARPVVALRACAAPCSASTGGPSPMAFTTVRTPSMSRVCVSNSILSSRESPISLRRPGSAPCIAWYGAAAPRRSSGTRAEADPVGDQRLRREAAGPERFERGLEFGHGEEDGEDDLDFLRKRGERVPLVAADAEARRPRPCRARARGGRRSRSGRFLPTHSNTMSGRAPSHRLDLGVETGAGERESGGAHRGGPLLPDGG